MAPAVFPKCDQCPKKTSEGCNTHPHTKTCNISAHAYLYIKHCYTYRQQRLGATFTGAAQHTTADLAKIGRETKRCQQRAHMYARDSFALARPGANNVLAHTQRQSKTIDRHAQIRLPSHLWILFLMLLVSISPKPCNGACAKTFASPILTLSLPSS